MIQMQEQSLASSKNNTDRRRGRPAGKNRTPLSLEERRARNAQYERERRNQTAEAMAHLAEAAGFESQISNADLLATVITQLRRVNDNKSKEDIEELKRLNNNLESQIAALESQLENDPELKNLQEILNASDVDEKSKSDLQSNSDTSDGSADKRPRKYRKKRRSGRIREKKQTSRKGTSHSDCSLDSLSSVWSVHKLEKSSSGQVQSDSTPAQTQSKPAQISNLEPVEHAAIELQPAYIKIKRNDESSDKDLERNPENALIDPYTDQEKGILQKLTSPDHDLIGFGNLIENQWDWTLSLDDYLHSGN